MYVLVTYNNEDQIKNKGARVVTLYSFISDSQVVGGRVWPKIKMIRVFMVVFVTCINEEDLFKNYGAIVVTTYFSL